MITEKRHMQIINKQRNLPAQLIRARHRVKQIEAECIMYGMGDLLTNPDHANKAFEREVAEAKAANTEGLER
jgi:hypothetical protein